LKILDCPVELVALFLMVTVVAAEAAAATPTQKAVPMIHADFFLFSSLGCFVVQKVDH
jgi:hypothetical protein